MRLKTVLGVSVAINVLCLGFVIVQAIRTSSAPATSPSSKAPATASGPAMTHKMEISAAGTASNARSASLNWVDALRAAGVPEKLIADVMSTDFDRMWEKRAREMQ